MLARVFIRSTRRSTAFLSSLSRDFDSLETDATAEDGALRDIGPLRGDKMGKLRECLKHRA
jgi:hypothetical protein